MAKKPSHLENMELIDFLENSYQNKKVFVTGHTGFKGSWLILWLTKLGAEIKGYSLPPEKNSLFEKIKDKIKIKSVYADICNAEKLTKEIQNFKPDFIFHLAAQALVRDSYEHPLETFEVNAMGTANVLQAVSKLKNKCVVVSVTTDKVYENKEQKYAYKEDDKLGGYDPYSASKACSELIIQSFRLSFFSPVLFDTHKKAVASVRSGNVIGGGDYSKDRIIPDIIRSLKKNQAIQIRNPKSVRPWQHVLDPLAGYILLGAKMNLNPTKYSTAFNFGPDPNNVITVEQLVKQSIKIYGKGKYFVESPKKKFHEAGLLMLDNSKAKNELGWNPLYDCTTTIEQTLNWYKKSALKKTDIYKLCIEDIRKYESQMK